MFTVWLNEKSKPALAKIVSTMHLPDKGIVVPVDTKGALPTMPKDGPLLMMGGWAVKHLKDVGLVKKNATLTSCRERLYEFNTQNVMLSFDPIITELDPDRLTDVQWDLQLVARLSLTGSLAPQTGKYSYTSNFDACLAYLRETDDRVVAFDLETVGLDPWALDAAIVSIAMSYQPGISDVVYVADLDSDQLKYLIEQVTRILTHRSVKVVAANGKYDAVWLAKHWGITGINQRFDTHLVGSLLDENRSNSLETHAKVYTTMGGYDTEFNRRYDKARMDLVPKHDLLEYAGGDTDACLQVYRRMRPYLVKDKRLTRFYVDLLQPAANVFTKVESRGVLVDRGRYKELEQECSIEIESLVQQGLALIPRKIKLKYADNLSLSRPTLLTEFLFSKRGLNLKPEIFTEKTQEPSTSMEHLQRFADHPVAGPFVEIMEKYNSAKKTMTTYIVGFQNFIRSDGMFHPTYRLGRGSSAEDETGGTVTGRLSATAPAYQTIPKRTAWAKRLRSVYIPPPGYGIAKFDFSQGELRIAAALANEPTMLRAYRDGIDLHALTAAQMMGVTIEQFYAMPEAVQDEQRRAAKAVNFGLLYGMGEDGLIDYARKSYGVLLTSEQSEKYRTGYFDTYKRLLPWHDECRQTAKQCGFIRNPLGRRRHLPLIWSEDRSVRSKQERQAVNSPVQSCLSDMMLLAMIELDRWNPDLWMFGMTHDSLETYLPLDTMSSDIVRIKEIMENLPLSHFGWTPSVQFVIDPEAGVGTLADVKKVKF